jgi:glycosyltransferase involved in cell wall biosynthesis
VHAVEEAVFMAMLARPLLGVPYVYDMDSSMSDQVLQKLPALAPLAPLLRAAERAAIRRAAAVAPVCDALAGVASAAGARRVVTLRDVSLLGEGPAPDGRREAVRGELGAGRGDVLALYVGNLEPYQGIDLLLDGFGRAAARAPALRLAIVGGTPDAVARYRREADARGVGERVRLVGPRPVARLAEYLGAADLLASPRVRGENTPMKVYSYLHAGRALLATDLPTHTQVLTGEVALLVPPSPDAVADGLVRLAGDPALRARLAAAGRRLVEARHSRAAYARQVAALYPPGTPAAPAPATAEARA